MKYRPWGPLQWVFSLSSQRQWLIIGTIGTEERSLAALSYINNLGMVVRRLFVEISDVDSEKYRDVTNRALVARRSEYGGLGGNVGAIVNMELLSELFQITDLAQRAVNEESVILDITSMPKRFFFPVLRCLIDAPAVKNLVVVYTTPGSYASDGPLYEDMDQWKVLPGFGGTPSKDELWIVSVGFLVESLRQYVSGNPDGKMKLFIPFPAPLSVMRRTWESVASLERDLPADRFEKFRMEPLDISSAFDRILSLAGQPARPLSFAPYGPKPISVAMCLYAIQQNSAVHYAQPTVYHPLYSKGIHGGDPAVAVNAYWIKHDGENLYAI